MKQVWKIGSIFAAVLVLWISLLLAKDLPPSLQLIVPYFPMYALASLGCYGLGALGYGMMVFRVCPEEADLLQKDIAEAKSFLKEHGVDVSSDWIGFLGLETRFIQFLLWRDVQLLAEAYGVG